MILNFDTEIAEIAKALDMDRATITGDQGMGVAMILVGVLDRGMAAERKRCLDIVARKAMNAAAVRQEIQRPIR